MLEVILCTRCMFMFSEHILLTKFEVNILLTQTPNLIKGHRSPCKTIHRAKRFHWKLAVCGWLDVVHSPGETAAVVSLLGLFRVAHQVWDVLIQQLQLVKSLCLGFLSCREWQTVACTHTHTQTKSKTKQNRNLSVSVNIQWTRNCKAKSIPCPLNYLKYLHMECE